jgi:hypothetical protein
MSEQLIGAFTIDVKVHVENKAEGTIGAVTIGLAPGKVPTLEALHRAVGQTLSALPKGYELLGGEDFFNKVLVKEKTGRIGNFATPSSFLYDVEALAAAGRAAYTPEPDDADDEPEDEEEFDDEDSQP